MKLVYKEEKKDLFSVTDDFYLVHFISADFAMEKGISVDLNKKENISECLNKMYPKGYGSCSGCILTNRVFNLITKINHWDKPTYITLKESLIYLRETVVDNEVKKLAMSRIGCDLDKLSWYKIRDMIMYLFNDIDVEILVCYL